MLTQHVEEEPVSHVALLDNGVDDLPPYEPEPDVEEVRPHLGADDDDDSVEDDEDAEHGQQDEPEPQEDVHLLVDYVKREEAERVVLLHLARRAKLVEGALGHPWEHIDEGVEAVLLVLLGKGNHFQAKREEGAVKEAVHQEHLSWKRWRERRDVKSFSRLPAHERMSLVCPT